MIEIRERIAGSPNGPVSEIVHAHIEGSFKDNVKDVSFLKHHLSSPNFVGFFKHRPSGYKEWMLIARYKDSHWVVAWLPQDVPEIPEDKE